MSKIVIVDSDALFAIYNPNDPLNARAVSTFQQLAQAGYDFVYPASVIFEVISLFQRVLPTPTVTAKLTEMIKNDQIHILMMDTDLLKAAVTLFDPRGSKKNTLIDCSVVAAARYMHAEAVFSYDEFYRKQGLMLAENLGSSNL